MTEPALSWTENPKRFRPSGGLANSTGGGYVCVSSSAFRRNEWPNNIFLTMKGRWEPNRSRSAEEPPEARENIFARRNLQGEALDGLDRVRRAAPSQELQFFVFERVGGLEKFFQFLDCPCGKTPHILQISFEG